MYNNIREIYLSNQPMFSMAVAYLLDVGFRNVRRLTEADIDAMEGNGLMTADYVRDMVNMAREIADECGNDVVEIIQFCQAEDVFDAAFYADTEDDDVDDLQW